jgi:sortase A
MRRVVAAIATLLIASGGVLLGGEAWLSGKAALARVLIDRAFAAHLADGAPHRPWSWADTYPIAHLQVPRLGVGRTVLAGASGSSLAFGAGHLDGTALPNRRGNSVVAGHRDGEFAFLERLRAGDALWLTTREGTWRYRVVELSVRSMWDSRVVEARDGRILTLVTCFPFDAAGATDRRFVAVLRAVDPPRPPLRAGGGDR